MTPITKKQIINLSFIVVLLLTLVIFNALLQANMAHSQINDDILGSKMDIFIGIVFLIPIILAEIDIFYSNWILNEKLKEDLFDAAAATHELLRVCDTHITASVNTYYIAGEGHDTVSGYTFGDSNFIPSQNESGDNTVLTYSATINDLFAQKTFFVMSKHIDLANPAINSALFEFIRSLINGGYSLPEGVNEEPENPV